MGLYTIRQDKLEKALTKMVADKEIEFPLDKFRAGDDTDINSVPALIEYLHQEHLIRFVANEKFDSEDNDQWLNLTYWFIYDTPTKARSIGLMFWGEADIDGSTLEDFISSLATAEETLDEVLAEIKKLA